MDPLVEALRRYVMSTDKLHGDDTPLPVLEPGRGRTRISRFWTYGRSQYQRVEFVGQGEDDVEVVGVPANGFCVQ